jgi:heterodisulfide reductase subunit A-like polyferredoxin
MPFAKGLWKIKVQNILSSNTNHAIVIGGGLAGCEATWQLLNRGIQVTLYEMKPSSFTPAHKSVHLAELVIPCDPMKFEVPSVFLKRSCG